MMQFDRDKLNAAILYTCGRCREHDLGAVKLNKVLYFADMLRFIQNGTSITGSTYRKRRHGPTCDEVGASLRALEQAEKLRIGTVDYFGYLKKQYTALADPEPRLSSAERAILDDVIDFVCFKNTARTISEFSHQSPWELADFGDVIPYTSAFRLIPSQTSEEAVAWASEQEALIERARGSSKVETQSFGTLRSRVLERMGREP